MARRKVNLILVKKELGLEHLRNIHTMPLNVGQVQRWLEYYSRYPDRFPHYGHVSALPFPEVV